MEWFGSEGSLKVIPFPALGRFTFTVPGCSSVQPGCGMGLMLGSTREGKVPLAFPSQQSWIIPLCS